ncbi:MAG TPA: glycosyl hydrolase family 65 protein [Jatrophihabitans sp.]|uniref:glycosyl hydrolase family 65 protein n=1 Tax=Jatrophihabitans sp. TaxID=1932789 RepID=UPI002DFCB24D|nr:glycosyl hydrolase family 65 protein [Jatrophihabitans sp.]
MLDPDWSVIEVSSDPLRRRITEALFTLGAGGFGTRGSVEEPVPDSVELVVCAGVYAGPGPTDGLLPCPTWTALDIDPAGDDEAPDDHRVLDLRTGVLERTTTRADGAVLRTLRFASAARPGLVCLRASGPADVLRAGGGPLRAPKGAVSTSGTTRGRQWVRVVAPSGTGVVALGTEQVQLTGTTREVSRIAAYAPDRPRTPGLAGARTVFDDADEVGIDGLLEEHRAVWERRWATVDVAIPGDPDAQLAARFALFQLWTNVARHDEMAAGARGVSGSGYSGHVFWDADVFVLPAMTTIDPRAAAAMIRYRCRRLDAARRWARAAGRSGARFPWESAASGADVTPREGALGGQLVPILTGVEEEHITADVAWALAHHHAWSHGGAPMPRNHRAVLSETARYWASRVTSDGDGAAHIAGVIGPDEYHEDVDDNAFTNGMARWNLRAAARHAAMSADPAEITHWREVADRIVDGYDPVSGVYEQFRGYFALERLLVAEVATPPVAIDLVLGRERVRASQLIKQPDVLMLHHLVPDDVRPGSLRPNVDFYGPRTAHGSSLSPAVTASLLARAGRADDALALFRVAARLDLDDRSGMTAAGLHLANIGGLWQCLVGGFLGATVRDGVLVLDPHLPAAWPELELRLRCLGRRIRVRVDRGDVVVDSDRPLRAGLAGGPVLDVHAPTELASGRVVAIRRSSS